MRKFRWVQFDETAKPDPPMRIGVNVQRDADAQDETIGTSTGPASAIQRKDGGGDGDAAHTVNYVIWLCATLR